MKTLLILLSAALISISSSVVTSRIIIQPAHAKQFYIKYFDNSDEATLVGKKLHLLGWVNIQTSCGRGDQYFVASITAEKY